MSGRPFPNWVDIPDYDRVKAPGFLTHPELRQWPVPQFERDQWRKRLAPVVDGDGQCTAAALWRVVRSDNHLKWGRCVYPSKNGTDRCGMHSDRDLNRARRRKTGETIDRFARTLAYVAEACAETSTG